ncbi:MAG: hypothetical protein AAGD43_06595 [Pseudomonadota bacterium]
MNTQVSRATGLDQVSKALQSMHRHLLTFQAERAGFTGSPLKLFDRATKDSAFEWLKPLRDTIVALDERCADKQQISSEESQAYGDQCRALLNAEPGPFRDGLNAAFQSNPEAIWAVGNARRAIEALG